jgi:hypothetical protein
MWNMRRRSQNVSNRSSQGDVSPRRTQKTNHARLVVENLEARRVCSAGAHALAIPSVHHHAEIRQVVAETSAPRQHNGAAPLFLVQAAKKKQANFTLAQVQKFLPGKWYAISDVSAAYGIQGALTAVEVVFTGPNGVKTFSAISALSVPGYFGRAYYQFGDSGTYAFINKKLVRMTITQASPTEYLGNPILVMSGQFLGVQFIDKNHFVDHGVTYTREPLNQTIFSP